MSRPPKQKDDRRERSFTTYVKETTYDKLSEYCDTMKYPSISYATSIILEQFLNVNKYTLKSSISKERGTTELYETP